VKNLVLDGNRKDHSIVLAMFQAYHRDLPANCFRFKDIIAQIKNRGLEKEGNGLFRLIRSKEKQDDRYHCGRAHS
jgi:hypothetical protein